MAKISYTFSSFFAFREGCSIMMHRFPSIVAWPRATGRVFNVVLSVRLCAAAAGPAGGPGPAARAARSTEPAAVHQKLYS